MDTVLTIVLLAGSIAFVIEEEVRVRKADQKAAHDRPLIIETVRLEVKLRRHAEELRSHLTDEDLAFLARNGSDLAQTTIDEKKKKQQLAAADAERKASGELALLEGALYSRKASLRRLNDYYYYGAKTHRYYV